ncbi:FecR family protein [Maribellus maritimus]|uniref:FecR family protein n=1 Tax=Maribellus maritimus TaxID=2870838 RepID=UPI001EEAFE52|nr:FecR domain-containing protein [Maribellus maritimus]MCG6190832.1 DUF4974 domain-containing protein [Maribellus maritimus]
MDYLIIKKYLEGQTTEEESGQAREWLKDPGNDSESREILGDIWANSEISLNGPLPDFNMMLDHVHNWINSPKRNTPTQRIYPARRLSILFSTFSKVAAILILPLLLVSLWLYYNPKQDISQVTSTLIREVYTKPGTRTKLELPDGTFVWLNDGTTFRYPEHFVANKNREVYVDGEAYFEVKSNPDNPFVVNNPMLKTVVTGTHFNINAYEEDHFFEATLLEGKINLQKNNQEFEIKPGEQVQYDALSKKIVRKNVNPEDATAWINGKLIFKDEKLEVAVKKLGRWYNAEIILIDAELKDYLLTGTIQKEKLVQMLDMISSALPVRYEYKKEHNPLEIKPIIYVMKK